MTHENGSDNPYDFILHYLRRSTGADEVGLDALKHMDAERTAKYIAKVYGEHAGEEALMRSLICERQLHRTSARFWLGIYDRIVGV